jgi:ATP-dependent protease ClpP protease subunit
MAKVVALESLPEVFLTEDITRESATRAVEQLSQYRGKKVALSIFSNGGDAKAGNFLAKWIANPANEMDVEARVYGNASSAAMIVAASCHARYIAAGSFANVHHAYAVDAEGNVVAEKDQSAETREALAAINSDQVALFQRVTGNTKAQVEELMREDRDVPSEKAVEFGLFDGIIPQAAKLAAYKQIPSLMASDEKKTVAFKVSAGDALKAIGTGEVHVPVEQVTAAQDAQATERNTRIAALEKELSDLKAANVAAETEKTTALAAAEALNTKLVASEEKNTTLTAKVDELTKTPLKAQTLPDGTTQVVTPGGEVEGKKGPELSARARYAQESNNEWLAAKNAAWGKPAQA